MPKFYLAIVFSLVLVLSGCSLLLAPPKVLPSRPVQVSGLPKHKLIINGVTLTVEIAVSNKDKAQGLSDRLSLPENAGMIFIFDEPTRPNFWMNRMHFPLDFLWLKDNKIVEISPNITAPTANEPNPAMLSPKVLIDSVIEINAGWAERFNIEVGQTVEGLTEL